MTSVARGPARAEFTRDEMIDGLRDLVSRLRGTGQPSRIQIVGGAAIALTLNEHRSATADIDGPVSPPEVVLAVAGTIAAERNWRDDWLNDAATQFLPTGYGRPAGWVTIYDADGVTVQVADAETLLAMKVYAAQKRGRRELEDLEVLIPAVGLTTVDDVENLYESFYPGDELTERTARIIQAVLDLHAAKPSTPSVPDLGR
jgi:hypothetical protein